MLPVRSGFNNKLLKHKININMSHFITANPSESASYELVKSAKRLQKTCRCYENIELCE